ncbi:molybdenum ABC transporter ATP-binding protein [Sulfurirhabdus autotrophica]|uniref:Molybdate transport system ATP-binding protein n=1 Tax=Sulfurirhabdus autotrophica TaxID=1706046 RepID=A0A4R3Y4Q1_9PROT|nr:molybdenum ABC transporter ATP-binding protein [Sulfurirhabdus autotrophica]TCV86730.1 molybdate transport system ATP-binding protein [Sulfurirhabdus autotrophica]
MSSIRARFTLSRSEFCLETDFEIPGKGVTALFGQSGSGKTTLLRCLAGLERAKDGLVVVNGECWQDESNKLFLPIYQRSLGYVFQDARLFPHLNVQRNLEYGWKRILPGQRRVIYKNVVEWLGLEHLLKRTPEKLSGGEKQRVSIARALLTSPQLLIMDEPLASLDSVAKAEILPYLEKLHQTLSIPVLYVSHSLEEVARLADFMLLLKSGKLIASGKTTEVMTRLDLPLSHLDEACASINTTVVGHDETYNLTNVEFSGGTISVSRLTKKTGDSVRVQILAKDVSLTMVKPQQTSILNVFEACIIEISDDNSSKVLIKLTVGKDLLLARITRKSLILLGLSPGQKIFAQVKSVALLS